MNEKNMVNSSRLGITRTSSSVYGKDFLELVWENGQIHAGDNNNRTRNTPFCIGYSVNPSSLKNEEDDDVIMRSSKRARLSNNSYKPNQEFSNFKTSKLISWGAQKPFTAVVRNSHTQETKKPRIHSSLTATKNSQKQYLGSSTCCDQRTRKVNFSNFSIPAVFLKSTSARSSARVEKKIQYLKGTEEEVAASTSNKEADHIGFQEQTSLTANKAKPESASSEALREKRKSDDETNLCNERSSSSVCSLEASNNPNFSIIKHHEEDTDDDDDDDSAYLSDDDEETENLVRDSNRIKRRRNAESHSLSERKQRDKINEKIRTLKDLIPNCNKVDKASMLDDAIEYLKTLKLQLEIMSMGRGLCMPHMMLPNHMNVAAQHLMGFSTPPQFPIPPLSSVTDNNRLQMFGFSNQMLQPMPIPNAPLLFPMIGNTSIQPFNAANLARHLANPGQLTTPEV